MERWTRKSRPDVFPSVKTTQRIALVYDTGAVAFGKSNTLRSRITLGVAALIITRWKVL